MPRKARVIKGYKKLVCPFDSRKKSYKLHTENIDCFTVTHRKLEVTFVSHTENMTNFIKDWPNILVNLKCLVATGVVYQY